MGLDLNAPFGDDIHLVGVSDVGILGNRKSDFDFLTDREELIQRLIRRLLTTPGEWIVFPAYGGGLRERVGESISAQWIASVKAVVLDQVLQEPDIAHDPPPTVRIQTLQPAGEGVYVSVSVFTRPLGIVSFTFNPSQTTVI